MLVAIIYRFLSQDVYGMVFKVFVCEVNSGGWKVEAWY